MSQGESRQMWNSKMGFILSAIGSAVGLGNIWRFPSVLYENGGGGFLMPYFIAIFTAGIPLLILEYTLGVKYRGSAPLSFARINKKYEYIGWIPSLIAFFIILYYSSIVSWAINYVILSFSGGWGSDPNNFFFGDFLQVSKGAFHIGKINVPILIGLIVVWGGTYILCSKSISKGIEKVNKVLLPILVVSLIIIVIRGVMFEGAAKGLNQLFTPDFTKLLDPKVWLSAYAQVFFSLSIAMGVMITYTSYLPKKSDIVNTAYITGLANSTFEFTIAIGIFGILGYMATQQGVDISEVVDGGVGLAFVVFPTAFNLMGSFGYILGIIFFSTLVFAGFTSFVSLTESFIMPLIDKFNINRKKAYMIVCGGGFVISSVFATGAGLYILDISDYYINNIALISLGILEAVVIAYGFDLEKIRNYANQYSFMQIGKGWTLCIKLVIPVLLSLNLILVLIDEVVNGYGEYKKIELLVFGVGTLVCITLFALILKKISWNKPNDLDFVVDEE